MKISKYLAAILVLAIFIAGCRVIPKEKDIVPNTVPYATLSELQALAIDADHPSWRSIRIIAIMEFEALQMKEKASVDDDWSFSEYPVLSRNADGSIRRYDYQILDAQGMIMATVGVAAIRGDSVGVIHEIFPFPRDYSNFTQANSGRKTIFPGQDSGDAPKEPDQGQAEMLKAQLEALSDEELSEQGMPPRLEMLTLIANAENEAREEGRAFWDAVASNSEALEAQSDIAARSIAFHGNLQAAARGTTQDRNYYILPA
jgi:hypothetical protein